MRQALEMMREDFADMEAAPRILVGGSLYLVGEVFAENGIITG